MLSLLNTVHGQTPVDSLTESQYGAAMIAIADQMEAQLCFEVGDNENHRSQCFDALTNSQLPGMTVHGWLQAACSKVCIDHSALKGIL